jgi:hypothetical protein
MLLALSLLLSGCGVSYTTTVISIGPTATTIPSSLPAASPAAVRACGIQNATPVAYTQPVPYIQLGDLVIGRATLGSLSYPSVALPAGTPLKPLKVGVPVSDNVFIFGGPLDRLPPVNPALQGNGAGYQLSICNASSTVHHTLQGVSARIESLTPSSGQLAVWKTCDEAYWRPHGETGATQQPQSGSVCGGLAIYGETLQATFPAAAGQGATVTTQQLSDGQKDGGPFPVGPLPLSLPPGENITIDVQMAPLGTPGTYLFAFGLTVDGAAPTYVPATQLALFAPAAHTFTGVACEQPSMASQIPQATNPPTFYVCPEA